MTAPTSLKAAPMGWLLSRQLVAVVDITAPGNSSVSRPSGPPRLRVHFYHLEKGVHGEATGGRDLRRDPAGGYVVRFRRVRPGQALWRAARHRSAGGGWRAGRRARQRRPG